MKEEQKQDYKILVAKKSERLVTALYLVTDLMTEGEPIKHSLRKNSVALLSSMNALSQVDTKDKFSELRESLKAVTEILSLMHVAVTTGRVSEMNGELLIGGFRSLQVVLEKKQPIFTKEMFATDGEDLLEKETTFAQMVVPTSYDAVTPRTLARLHDNERDLRKTVASLKQARLLSRLTNQTHKGQNAQNAQDGTIKDNKSTHSVLIEQSDRATQSLASSFQMRKKSRREQVLALFVKGVDVSIKDISARIRGCSEKTIQRELNSLLEDNVIERIGEKRWSRYILR